MKITHVIRGSEWLPTFPLHGLIHRAFGWQEPVWVHLSVFLKPSGKGKMSKREKAEFLNDGYSIFVKDLRGLGFLPEAVVNWTALIGWSYDDHTEFFTLEDLKEKFSLERLNPSPAAINFTKLDHFNGLHIRNLTVEELAKRVKPFFIENGLDADDETLIKISPIIQERLQGLDHAPEIAGIFFRKEIDYSAEDLVVKEIGVEGSLALCQRITEILDGLAELSGGTTEPPLRELVEKSGLKAGQVFGVMRIAITGQRVSPPLFETMEIIGKDTVMERMRKAVAALTKLARMNKALQKMRKPGQ